MRFVQVGVGGFGAGWLGRLHRHVDVELVGIVDINNDNIAKAKETAGDIPAFPSLTEAIQATQPEAVVIVTPPQYHRQDVELALNNGIHVISEKPMADTLENCLAMTKTAETTGKIYCVSQNYRYNPVAWTMAEIISSGRLGRIGQVKVDFLLGMDFNGGFRHSMEYPVIIDMSIHHFDLMRFITKLNAINVRAAAWNPFWSNYKGDCSSSALFTMTNNVHLLYNASWCCKGQYSSWNGNWMIECDKGCLICDNDQLRIVWTKPESRYTIDHTETVAPLEPPLRGQDYILNDFLNAIRNNQQPETCASDNLKSIAMVFATVEAIKSAQEITVQNS